MTGRRKVGRPRKSTTGRTGRNRAPIFVQVARTGGTVKRYCLNGARTAGAALEVAGITPSEADRVRVNGRSARRNSPVKNGDIVTLAGRVEGGLA